MILNWLEQHRSDLLGLAADLVATPSPNLPLVVNADEERSMKYGSEFLAAECGIKADAALLGEPSAIDGPEFEFLHLLSRGITCFRVRIYGTQMHSSLSDRLRSINANIK